MQKNNIWNIEICFVIFREWNEFPFALQLFNYVYKDVKMHKYPRFIKAFYILIYVLMYEC